MVISPNGHLFATVGTDRKIRIFDFLSGKLNFTINETMQLYVEQAKENKLVLNIFFLAMFLSYCGKIENMWKDFAYFKIVNNILEIMACKTWNGIEERHWKKNWIVMKPLFNIYLSVLMKRVIFSFILRQWE